MLRLVSTLLASSLSASAALAEPKWNGAGWYQLVFLAAPVGVTEWIHAGPYSSEDQCKASLPPSSMDSDGGIA